MPNLKTKLVPSLAALGAAMCLAFSANAQEMTYPETADPEVSEPASDAVSVPDTLTDGLTLTKADGTSMTMTFANDASFTTDAGEAGSWSYEDGYLCLTGLGETSQCTLMPSDAAAGSSWSVTTADGGEMVFAIPDGEDDAEADTAY